MGPLVSDRNCYVLYLMDTANMANEYKRVRMQYGRRYTVGRVPEAADAQFPRCAMRICPEFARV